ncbi:MAG: hypothetical protein U5R46_01655 [Gammaproteobacteria bacterium]|nr:hypothetical protein [Gammaproteobacteria bacterium]
MSLNPSMHRLLAGILGASLISCSGGITSSGGSADTSTGDVAGVYTGQEHLTLVRREDGVALDTATNRVNITVSGDGTVRISSSSGTSGDAQLTRHRSFRMSADARTHFTGSCSGGFVLLEGRINMNDGITGEYRSRELICGGVAHDLTGTMSASRE